MARCMLRALLLGLAMHRLAAALRYNQVEAVGGDVDNTLMGHVNIPQSAAQVAASRFEGPQGRSEPSSRRYLGEPPRLGMSMVAESPPQPPYPSTSPTTSSSTSSTTPTSPTTTTAAPPSTGIPLGYEVIPEVGYFRLHKPALVTWEGAQTMCDLEGASMADLNNSMEQYFALQKVLRHRGPSSAAWLRVKKTSRHWTRIESFLDSFNGWRIGEPNGSGDCLYMDADGVGDFSCDWFAYTLCQISSDKH